MREAMVEGYKREDGGREHRVRPYYEECTAPHPNSEVKPRQARSVLRWGTTREQRVLYPSSFYPSSPLLLLLLLLLARCCLLLGAARSCCSVFVSRKPCLLRVANHTIEGAESGEILFLAHLHPSTSMVGRVSSVLLSWLVASRIAPMVCLYRGG